MPADGTAVLVATFLNLEVQLHAWASSRKLCYWEVTQVTSQTSSASFLTLPFTTVFFQGRKLWQCTHASEAPQIQVSVTGKDSPTLRQKAIDKIAQMSHSGELPAQLLNGLSVEQLLLIEAPSQTADLEFDAESDPLIVAVRELNKFSPLKIKTQRLKQAALESRRNIDVLFTESPIEEDLDQLEEILKASFKTLKEFAFSLVEYRQAKPRADSARIILDEALQLGLSTPSTSESNTNSLTGTQLTSPETIASLGETEASAIASVTKNGQKRRA